MYARDRPFWYEDDNIVVDILDLIAHVTLSQSRSQKNVFFRMRQHTRSGTRLFFFNSGPGRISDHRAAEVASDNFRVRNPRRTGSYCTVITYPFQVFGGCQYQGQYCNFSTCQQTQANFSGMSCRRLPKIFKHRTFPKETAALIFRFNPAVTIVNRSSSRLPPVNTPRLF